MSEKTDTVTDTAPQPASLAQLKAAFPKAGADFVVGQLEAGATLEAARGAWNDVLQARLDSQEAELAKIKKGGAKVLTEGRNPAAKETETEPASTFEGDAVSQMSAAVADKMKLGLKRRDAIKAVAKTQPELHRAYLEQTNPPKVHELIAERFE